MTSKIKGLARPRPAPSSAAARRRSGLPSPRPPQRLSELGDAEALLLRSLRHWIVGLHHGDHDAWSMAWNALARSLGSIQARDAMAALSALVSTLCGHARRRIAYHQPCCSCLGPDEACLLALVTDCQAGELEAAKLRAAWLVDAAGVAELLEAADLLAESLATRGYRLTRRPEARPSPTRTSCRPVLAAVSEA